MFPIPRNLDYLFAVFHFFSAHYFPSSNLFIHYYAVTLIRLKIYKLQLHKALQEALGQKYSIPLRNKEMRRRASITLSAYGRIG
jgi:hypothetical protein